MEARPAPLSHCRCEAQDSAGIDAQHCVVMCQEAYGLWTQTLHDFYGVVKTAAERSEHKHPHFYRIWYIDGGCVVRQALPAAAVAPRNGPREHRMPSLAARDVWMETRVKYWVHACLTHGRMYGPPPKTDGISNFCLSTPSAAIRCNLHRLLAKRPVKVLRSRLSPMRVSSRSSFDCPLDDPISFLPPPPLDQSGLVKENARYLAKSTVQSSASSSAECVYCAFP